MRSVKQRLICLISAILLAISFAACGAEDYLSWKAEDYRKADAAEKLRCVEAFTNAALKAQDAEEISGDELTASAQALQAILESGLNQYPDKSIREIIEMTLAARESP